MTVGDRDVVRVSQIGERMTMPRLHLGRHQTGASRWCTGAVPHQPPAQSRDVILTLP